MTVCFMVMMSKLQLEDSSSPIVLKLYKHHDQELRFAERFKSYENIKFVLCDTYEEVIRDTDLIISAVTQTTENFAPDECYKEGVTVIPICTLGFQNCDLFFDKVYTDEIEQIRGFKYFNQFKSLYNVSDVLDGMAPGRTSGKERILVYNYGIGIHDLYFAKKFYDEIQGKEIEYNFCKRKYFI